MLGLSVSEWISLAGLLGPVLTGVLVAYARKHFATQAQHRALTQRVDALDGSVAELKVMAATTATREQVHNIEVQNAKMLGEISTLGAHVEGAVKVVDRMNNFLWEREKSA